MNRNIFLAFFILLLTSCQPEDPVNFEAFNPEAFAYDLGDTWEVNATVRVRGFKQNRDEENGSFSASIRYTVDLRKPNGETDTNKFSFTAEPTKNEKFIDVGLDAQFELPFSYEDGVYTALFKIKDLNSGQETSTIAEFELRK